MKKAFLITFDVCVRVVADVPEGYQPGRDDMSENFDKLVKTAREKIVANAEDILCGDNVTEAWEDTEMPYGSFKNEK